LDCLFVDCMLVYLFILVLSIILLFPHKDSLSVAEQVHRHLIPARLYVRLYIKPKKWDKPHLIISCLCLFQFENPQPVSTQSSRTIAVYRSQRALYAYHIPWPSHSLHWIYFRKIASGASICSKFVCFRGILCCWRPNEFA